MPELFPEFISSPDAFDRAKAFWQKLADEEAAALGQSSEWRPWFSEAQWRDSPILMDGAVVFSLYSESQNKGLRVQQSACSASKKPSPYVASFTDTFGEGGLERPIPNLFIGAIPTDENENLIHKIVGHWFRTEVDSRTMQAFLEKELYGPNAKKG